MGEAAKRTAAKINAGGGVLGRKLELFIEDSESSAAVAANLSHKFINVHKAQALVGYWGTPEGMSSRPIAIQNKVVLMVSSAANAITEGDTQGYVWRFQRSEEHTSELQSHSDLVCRLLLEKKKLTRQTNIALVKV